MVVQPRMDTVRIGDIAEAALLVRTFIDLGITLSESLIAVVQQFALTGEELKLLIKLL